MPLMMSKCSCCGHTEPALKLAGSETYVAPLGWMMVTKTEGTMFAPVGVCATTKKVEYCSSCVRSGDAYRAEFPEKK